ncbi:MAG: Gfo/Idh/MocA family oxidoreductase [Gemmatimonadaceae bacterium]|nr:Gfo/Idh/MocA family oxidoreductase [Gemmatimonadaceae bacterium]
MMRWPSRDIWDTRTQNVCAVLSSGSVEDAEVYLTATFAHVSVTPPRVAINPNALYPIVGNIRRTGRFAVNVLGAADRDLGLRLMGLRRREPTKAAVLDVDLEERHGVAWLPAALRSVFCEVESIHDVGDHTLIVGRVIDAVPNARRRGERPLMFSRISGTQSRFPVLSHTFRRVLAETGLWHLLRKARSRLRPPPPPDIARRTFDEGGVTLEQAARVLAHGASDTGRAIAPSRAPAVLRREMHICVVGLGWGTFHLRLLREANPSARLYLCGRDADRTARLAAKLGLAGHFTGLDAALADPRIQGLTLAIPHDLHASAAQRAAVAGKHALVEKPIATSLADADAMIDAARRAGTILMCAEDMHFRPGIAEAVRRIRQGDIGEPLYLLAHAGGYRRSTGWAAQRERMGGGVLMDIGVHYVHALRLLMGEPDAVRASRAMQIDVRMEAEDSAQVTFASRLGWEAHLLTSWATSRGHLPDLVVLGDRGTIHLWPNDPCVDWFPAAMRPLTRLLSYVRPYALRDRLMKPEHQRVRTRLRGPIRTGYQGEMREFLSAIVEERAPSLPASATRRDLEIVLCAYEALAASPATITIPPLPRS